MRDLAAFFGVAPEEFTITNGTDEAIQLLINTFVDDGDDVLLLKPSTRCTGFMRKLAGASVREVEYGRRSAVSRSTELLAAISAGNARDPDRQSQQSDRAPASVSTQIELILETAPDAAVLIDEAYFEFCGVTALRWIREYPNLFVSRTFSKVYGMAAMRCGCLFSLRGECRVGSTKRNRHIA